MDLKKSVFLFCFVSLIFFQMPQSERDAIMTSFRSAEKRVLITTGFDFLTVS